MPASRKTKTAIAYADFGSHGGIFEFVAGPVADRYPHLLQIYSRPSPGLVKVRITPVVEREAKKKGT